MRFAPGPLGRRGGSVRLKGKKTSYIHFPNRRGGALDTSHSITILAWYFPEGTAGPLFNYHPSASGVRFRLRTPTELYVQFRRRRGRGYSTPLTSAVVQPRKWQFLGASYDRKTGTAVLWRNGKKIAKKFIGRIRLATNYPVRIGAKIGDRRYFKGKVTCLQVYTTSLNEAQVVRAARKCFKSGKLLKMVTFLLNGIAVIPVNSNKHGAIIIKTESLNPSKSLDQLATRFLRSNFKTVP